MVPSAKAGGSELHAAAAKGDTAAVEALLDVEKGGALVDPVKADGTTPLITAGRTASSGDLRQSGCHDGCGSDAWAGAGGGAVAGAGRRP